MMADLFAFTMIVSSNFLSNVIFGGAEGREGMVRY